MPDVDEAVYAPTEKEKVRARRATRYRRAFAPPDAEAEDVLEDAGPWTRRTARIVGADGEVFFEQRDVEAPVEWSDMAVNVVASKYLRGKLGEPGREDSVRTLVLRVIDNLSDWARRDEYLDPESAAAFRADLAFLLVRQMAAFNSPVWFNVGIDEFPQSSACFINELEDSMESILELARVEGMIFKRGSGAGVNLSVIRGREELLSGGGTASGPVSFMKGWDAFAGVIKSGGKTRRAAKIISLDVDHPDLLEFVRCKRTEEGKAAALEAAGYSGGMDGDASKSVFFQNANHSIRVSDAFMRAVEADENWEFIGRTTGCVTGEIPAREVWDLICETAHACGDPGIQFDDTVNTWHTCPEDGRIRASNPCGEFVFLDGSACNLASLNLRKFQDGRGRIRVEEFSSAVRTLILAQEILIDRSSYPTPGIERNSRAFRPLGLGYANLGAALMARGLPYDSEPGRAFAAGITSLMTAVAYRTSAELAERRGPFPGYARNRADVLRVLKLHRSHLDAVDRNLGQLDVSEEAARVWEDVLSRLKLTEHGLRNAQVTLLAPTGTIAFMMDCDTTGVEPDLAVTKVKTLAGGGEMRIENRTVEPALRVLGYGEREVDDVLEHLRETGGAAGSRALRPEHVPVFDCALPDGAGRYIDWTGHVRMLAAVQPFLSGAVSKTVNLPKSATPADVSAVYEEAWRSGLKSITVYRDTSKRDQPLRSGGGNGKRAKLDAAWTPPPEVDRNGRQKLPKTRDSVTHKIDMGGHEGYVTAGMYADGRLGELFVNMAKQGSTVSGLLDAWATCASIAVQYGVPYEVLKAKFSRTRFEPAGFSGDPRIGMATSVLDYIFSWLEIEFPGGVRDGRGEERAEAGSIEEAAARRVFDSGPPCAACGSIMQPNGGCHRCPTCGTTNGCG